MHARKNMTQILELLPKVAKEIGAIGKDKRNEQQKYSFRGIDQVVNAAHPAFVKFGVVITSEVIDQVREEHETRNGGTLYFSVLRIKFTFYAPDGSSVSSTTVGEGMDSGDKASNKAMSAALKYALGQTLLIPFELTDSEDDSPEGGGKKRKKKDADAAPNVAKTIPDKIDENFPVIINDVGDRRPLKDCTEPEFQYAHQKLLTAKSNADKAGDTGKLEKVKQLIAIAEEIAEHNKWVVTPF